MKPRTVRLDLGGGSRRNPPGTRERNGAGTRYRVVVDSGELAILRRDDVEDGGRVLMAGEILSPSTVLEVINTIAASRWVGRLQVWSRDAHRVLGFARGVLRHARSNHPEDRLDKILTRFGASSPTEVETAMREIRPDQRLGEVLVDRGVVSRNELFDFLHKQMEEILLSAVLEEEGAYLFTVHGEGEAPPSATGHIPVHPLLFSAAERVDNLGLFRRLVPSPDLCPEVESGLELTRLTPREQLVVGYCNGRRSVREIASETWLGRYFATEVVYRLVRDGCVRLEPPHRSPRQLATEITSPFNELLEEIYETLERWGDRQKVYRELAAWAAETPEREMVAACLDGDGLIDPEGVAANLSNGAADLRADEVRHALHELTAYALFTASMSLPRDVERELSRRVEEGLRGA